MVGENFRSWLAAWEKNGWLTRIRKPVNPQYVLGAVTKKLEKERGVIFEQVSGYSIPLATNFFFSRRALAAALDTAEGDLIPNFTKAMKKPRPCEGVGHAAFQENVLTQKLNPLQVFPAPTYHERDAGPYITGGVLIAKDPETGIRNASMHRLRVFDDDALGLLILPRHLNLCLHKCIQMKRPLEVAVAIGVDPFTLLASQAILPFGIDELEVASALRPNAPLKLARCVSVDLEVPADSEIVFEGIIDPAQTRVEGPFGEFPRYYSPEAPRPIFKLKAIAFRKDPVFYSILPASREHLLLGAIPREASILADVQRAVPSVRAVHLAYGGTCRYHLVISLVKRSEGEARMAMLAAMANNADIKHVVVVDEDIDIFDMEQVEWAVATRFQGDRDLLIIPKTQSSPLDPSSSEGVGTKMGLDATAPVGSLQKEFKRISIPGYQEVNVDEYLGNKGGEEMSQKTEIRDGMKIDWNVPLTMDDGIVLRADVYRPVKDGHYPVILTYGVYAKGLSYPEGYPQQWQKMVEDHPEILQGSTNEYQNWEVTDPERWVPHGYAVMRVDSRGAGWSPGLLDTNCPREIDDLYRCIEWAGTQPWSNGKVGMLGISYYASNQWRVAAKHPPHLAAIIPWEGFNDNYRDLTYHGGILCEFMKRWAPIQALSVQYGLGERAKKNPNTGESIAGPVTLSDEELAKNRLDPYLQSKAHPLHDEWHRGRSADLSQVTLPLLTCANWGGQGIHPRGNFNGFTETPSKQKWLEVHGDSHWSLFSAGYGINLQKRFFDFFLKGIDNGWDKTPRVQLNVRHPNEKFVLRMEKEWPLARTRWTKFYLDPGSLTLTPKPPAREGKVEYEALGKGVTFSMPPLEKETEITGPLAAKLFLSSSTKDTDLFLILRVFDPSGKELTFMGSTDPNTPIANGWLRASHRRLDLKRSKPYQPYHPHDRVEPLTPGEVYECDVEILPTSIVVPAGWRVALTLRGKDYEYEGELSEFGKKFYYATRGTGGMTHNDPDDRPKEVFGGKVTLYTGGGRQSYLLLPIIPLE